MSNSNALFEKIYRKIAVTKNYIAKPRSSGMDNWSMDRWLVQIGPEQEIIVGMSDAGYSRWVAIKVSGKIIWRVNDYYPNPLSFCDISEVRNWKLTPFQADAYGGLHYVDRSYCDRIINYFYRRFIIWCRESSERVQLGD